MERDPRLPRGCGWSVTPGLPQAPWVKTSHTDDFAPQALLQAAGYSRYFIAVSKHRAQQFKWGGFLWGQGLRFLSIKAEEGGSQPGRNFVVV